MIALECVGLCNISDLLSIATTVDDVLHQPRPTRYSPSPATIDNDSKPIKIPEKLKVLSSGVLISKNQRFFSGHFPRIQYDFSRL